MKVTLRKDNFFYINGEKTTLEINKGYQAWYVYKDGWTVLSDLRKLDAVKAVKILIGEGYQLALKIQNNHS